MTIEGSLPSALNEAGTSRDRQAAEVERLLRMAADDGRRRAELLEEAILAAVPTARAVASRYRHRGVDSEDLYQVAYVGLVKAVNGYQPGPDTDFRSYGIPTIQGEIRRYFRDRAWMVRPPRRIQDLQAAINTAEGELSATLRRWPTHQDLARHLGVPLEQIIEAQRAQGCFQPASLDARLSSAPSLSLGTMIPDPSDTYQLVDQVEALRPVVAELPDRDRLILRRRFVDHYTQAEIGAEIGVSQMQVSRLLRNIMLVMRSALTG